MKTSKKKSSKNKKDKTKRKKDDFFDEEYPWRVPPLSVDEISQAIDAAPSFDCLQQDPNLLSTYPPHLDLDKQPFMKLDSEFIDTSVLLKMENAKPIKIKRLKKLPSMTKPGEFLDTSELDRIDRMSQDPEKLKDMISSSLKSFT